MSLPQFFKIDGIGEFAVACRIEMNLVTAVVLRVPAAIGSAHGGIKVDDMIENLAVAYPVVDDSSICLRQRTEMDVGARNQCCGMSRL